MALCVKPQEVGGRILPPALVLDYEEALSLLALLNANPAYWNRKLREEIAKYIDSLPTK